MEEVGEKPIDANEVLGKVVITVYNDCFSVEHSATLSTEEVLGLFVATWDKLSGSKQEQKRNIH